MTWKSVPLPSGSKLFKSHNFTYMKGGTTFILEVDEFADGSCSGHGEHSTDKSSLVQSVSGSSVEECLKNLIENIG
jgi:hypothetical protein